jgi:dCTP deaminase
MNEAAILSDRQIRELCEKPVGEFRYTDSRGGAVTQKKRVQIYADQLVHGYRQHFDAYAEKHGGKQIHGTRITLHDVHSDVYRDHYRDFKPMIEPFSPYQVRTRSVCVHNATDGSDNDRYEDERIVSYGLTSFGYDVRCGREFKIFTNINSTVIDPKNFDDKNFVDFVGDVCIIPPNSFVLARTMERFDLPRDIVADCVGKSTYARCGISIMVTPLEPEWDGYLTLEFANTTPLPAKLYAGEGCGQIRFFRGSEGCETSYRDRGGKYLGQTDKPVTPKM